MGWILFHLTCGLILLYTATHQHHDLDAFDLRRCYALHQKLHCWPKHEACWFAEDRAICWQSTGVR